MQATLEDNQRGLQEGCHREVAEAREAEVHSHSSLWAAVVVVHRNRTVGSVLPGADWVQNHDLAVDWAQDGSLAGCCDHILQIELGQELWYCQCWPAALAVALDAEELLRMGHCLARGRLVLSALAALGMLPMSGRRNGHSSLQVKILKLAS